MNDNNTKNNCYDDIISLSHHVSTAHPHMPLINRAAQFSPFAALTGHNEAIKEAGRQTKEKKELDENAKNILNGKLQFLLEKTAEEPVVKITYFQPDSKKNGGSYLDSIGSIKKINPYRRMIIMCDGREIPIDNISEIQGETFYFNEYP